MTAEDFYKRADAIALNSQRLEVDTIYAIAEALGAEYRARFGGRFRKAEFLEKAGLV